MSIALSNDVRRIVTVETIRDIEPIANADAIESAVVRGWTVVVKKGEFQVGDSVIFFEIDSALPLDDPRFEFLAPRGTKTLGDGRSVHVLKTARLRGVYSQGLVLPLASFPELSEAFFDQSATGAPSPDLAEILGVIKYEPPLPANMGGNVVGSFPTHLGLKTDSERAQNLESHWPELASEEWVATEKVDGTSLSVFRDLEGALHVCSRNWELAEPESHADANVYWQAVYETGLDTLLAPGQGIQAEIAGNAVQGNPLGLNDRVVVVFSFLNNGNYLPRDQWPVGERTGNAALFAAPIYPITLSPTAAETVAEVDGIKSLISPKRNAEGVVFHHTDGKRFDFLGGRSNWKVISNKYLLKSDR